MDCQGTKRRKKIAENSNRLSRVHQRYGQTDRQTDIRQTETAIAYSEHELTFAKNNVIVGIVVEIMHVMQCSP